VFVGSDVLILERGEEGGAGSTFDLGDLGDLGDRLSEYPPTAVEN